MWMLIRDSGALKQFAALNVSPSANTAWAGFTGWLGSVAPSLAHLSTLKPDDPQYAYLFAIVLVGVIALPFGLYLIDRVIKRFFP
jgi:hypothetical protein